MLEDTLPKGTLKFGSFSKTSPKIIEKTGKKIYNVEIDFTFLAGMKMYAVLTENGTRMIMQSLLNKNKLEELFWISKEELEKLQGVAIIIQNTYLHTTLIFQKKPI